MARASPASCMYGHKQTNKHTVSLTLSHTHTLRHTTCLTQASLALGLVIVYSQSSKAFLIKLYPDV